MSKNDDEDSILDKTSIITSDTFKVRLAEAGNAPPSIVLLVGPAHQVGRQWPIEDTNLIIGRAVGAHIFVDDRSISKSHAKLVLDGGDVRVIDLESTNKTIVNTGILSPLAPQKLQNNDQIKTGNVIFKFLERGNIETVSVAQTFDRGLVDALTGIHNKGALEAQGKDAFKRAQLLGIPFSLTVFDIDHFKKVNDTYGHQAGDYVLKELATIVREKVIRGNDYFARSGGEEFCLLLLGSSDAQAMEITERLRSTIEAHEFSFDEATMKIRISCGVSTMLGSDQNWKMIEQRADSALYVSKNSGRNQIHFL